jgi:CRISPR-associated endonuclease/helicase Cas3
MATPAATDDWLSQTKGVTVQFVEFFNKATGWTQPRDWQVKLASAAPSSCLIRIPTGFGKTAGAALAWLWNRFVRNDGGWPRRLVWCLPMRVLVEQTHHEVCEVLKKLDILWDGNTPHGNKIGVHLLMGGADAEDWHLYPSDYAILIGTQDMLLSRAMNRGYGAARGRWPMDFGLLNNDSLWVMDEVQLMDVGLATSAQVQVFRNDSGITNPDCSSHTWWMSATLQRSWLLKSPDTQSFVTCVPNIEIPASGRHGHLWDDVGKPVRTERVNQVSDIAEIGAIAHLEAGRGGSGPTLIVVNTVRDSLSVYRALRNNPQLRGTDLRLVHSRFRPHERAGWRQEFLNRDACAPGTDRIIVATQVVEAGVDMSAAVLLTTIAPWASLVQRFGRAARYGGSAQIIIADHAPVDDKTAVPYTKSELDAAREAISLFDDVAPIHLESFEENHVDMLSSLYPYEPRHLLLRHELEELFDTTPDLSGADVEISRFIRSGDERDLQVFWQDVAKDEHPDRKLRPAREALCAIPFLKARDWLCGTETKSSKAPSLKKGMRAWVWDWLDGRWRQIERSDLFPGQTVLVAAECGGYQSDVGWDPDSSGFVPVIEAAEVPPDEFADSSEEDETLSELPSTRSDAWQTIANHGLAVGTLASAIATPLMPGLASLFHLAGRWHDAGKAHDVFQNSITGADRPVRRDLAKAPKRAWLSKYKLYPDNDGRRRQGFRHELASTLALFAVLQRNYPDHPALLGPWRSFLEEAGMPPPAWSAPQREPTKLEREILDLSADDFDLLAYLVCAHHGKVRMAWHASPWDQQAADDVLRIRGIRDGEELPSLMLATIDGEYLDLVSSALNLAPSAVGLNNFSGRGWTERVLELLKRHGMFSLALMEAILRAADQRASRETMIDPLIDGDVDA